LGGTRLVVDMRAAWAAVTGELVAGVGPARICPPVDV
jgi:hypothetical protein